MELDLETRIEIVEAGLKAVDAQIAEIEKKMNDFEEWLDSWKS